MTRLISNNYISTDALYSGDTMAHSFSWSNHRYVRREGSPGKWRYIYPEDLKKAGQRLVSGVRNAVSNTIDTARKIYTDAGFPQRKAYRRADKNHDRAIASVVKAHDPIKSPELGSKNDPRRSRALARASVIERKSVRTVQNAAKQYFGTAAQAIDYAKYNIRDLIDDGISFAKSSMKKTYRDAAASVAHIDYEVSHFLKNLFQSNRNVSIVVVLS